MALRAATACMDHEDRPTEATHHDHHRPLDRILSCCPHAPRSGAHTPNSRLEGRQDRALYQSHDHRTCNRRYGPRYLSLGAHASEFQLLEPTQEPEIKFREKNLKGCE